MVISCTDPCDICRWSLSVYIYRLLGDNKQLEKNYLLQAGALEQTMVLGTDEVRLYFYCIMTWTIPHRQDFPVIDVIINRSNTIA